MEARCILAGNGERKPVSTTGSDGVGEDDTEFPGVGQEGDERGGEDGGG